MKKYQSSSIGLIPSHGCSGNNNHSKESIEWLNVLQQQWHENGKIINIQHGRSPSEEKALHVKAKQKISNIKWMVTLNLKVENMCVNTMDVPFKDVFNVFQGIGK